MFHAILDDEVYTSAGLQLSLLAMSVIPECLLWLSFDLMCMLRCSERTELKSNRVYLAIVAVCQSGRATPCHTQTNQSRQDDHLTVHGFIRVQSNTFNTVRFTQSLPHNHNTLQDFRNTNICVQTRLRIHAELEDTHLQGWKVSFVYSEKNETNKLKVSRFVIKQDMAVGYVLKSWVLI